MRQAGTQGVKRCGKPWRTTTPDPTASRPIWLSATSARHLLMSCGGRLHLPQVLGTAGVLQLRARRLLPPCRRLATRLPRAPALILNNALWMALSAVPAVPLSSSIDRSDAGWLYTSQVRADPRRPRRAGLDRQCLQQRHWPRLVDSFKNQANYRPRLARHIRARTRDRRIHRLLQRRPAPPGAR